MQRIRTSFEKRLFPPSFIISVEICQDSPEAFLHKLQCVKAKERNIGDTFKEYHKMVTAFTEDVLDLDLR